MKPVALTICCLHFILTLCAQKEPIGQNDIQNWEQLSDQMISYDGKFIVYTYGRNLVIKATDNSWERRLTNVVNPTITEDNRFVIFAYPSDSIGLFQPTSNDIEVLHHVSIYKLPKHGNGQWMAYRNAEDSSVVLVNLLDRRQTIYTSTNDFLFSDNGEELLTQRSYWQSGARRYQLSLTNLADRTQTVISTSDYLSCDFVFDSSGMQLVFITKRDVTGYEHLQLRYFRRGMDSAMTKASESTSGMEGLRITQRFDMPMFSCDGEKLFFAYKHSMDSSHGNQLNNDKESVNIWSYTKRYLSSRGELSMANNDGNIAVMAGNKISKVTDNGEIEYSLTSKSRANYVLVSTRGDEEKYWRTDARPTWYLVSTADGSRRVIANHLRGGNNLAQLSPDEKYVIYYYPEKRSYYCYNVNTGSVVQIGCDIHYSLFDDENDKPGDPFAFGIAGWLGNDSAVYIYDRFDIWKIDPAGVKGSYNITAGYGRKNKIVFRSINLGNEVSGVQIFHSNQSCLLAAFDKINKNNGFYLKEVLDKGCPEKLTMEARIYYFPFKSGRISCTLPAKAKNSDLFILSRMSPTEAPNVFLTTDFRSFRQMSDIDPQKSYNWISAELVHWKMFDGKGSEGILYKPENFDPNKKYPVIFYFYEKNADDLNNFITPGLSDGAMNIPYFVSNGYIVFDPNIYYKVGSPGESVYNSVVSAAKYLSKLPWIDSAKFGLQGHSFGGYEVNYLIANSRLFKAASESAGASDFVSYYGGFFLEGSSQFYFESGQGRLGATLWQNPALYFNNSPIFKADRISTPLLIMHNKDDRQVPWGQGVELFMALRRLGRKVWMLQYDDEGHQLSQQADQLDFSARQKQFFDHFLKGDPKPAWML